MRLTYVLILQLLSVLVQGQSVDEYRKYTYKVIPVGINNYYGGGFFLTVQNRLYFITALHNLTLVDPIYKKKIIDRNPPDTILIQNIYENKLKTIPVRHNLKPVFWMDSTIDIAIIPIKKDSNFNRISAISEEGLAVKEALKSVFFCYYFDSAKLTFRKSAEFNFDKNHLFGHDSTILSNKLISKDSSFLIDARLKIPQGGSGSPIFIFQQGNAPRLFGLASFTTYDITLNEIKEIQNGIIPEKFIDTTFGVKISKVIELIKKYCKLESTKKKG